VITKDDLQWAAGDASFTLHGLDFVSAHWDGQSDGWVAGENCFHIAKTRALIEQYLKYFNELDPRPSLDHIVELGLYDGGSIPFWVEFLGPKKHVGFDWRPEPALPYLDAYLDERGLRDRVTARWGIDVTQRERMLREIRNGFGDEPLDVIIDDASHTYERTLANFEILFPLLRPRGLYIIEDWAWFHWRGIEADWRDKTPTTQLITELVEAAGSSRVELIESLHVCNGYVIARRGYTSADELQGFALSEFIYRHPR
jgi:hypothetical protein